MRKTGIGLLASFLTVAAAWTVGAKLVEEKRFWAKRIVEVQLAGLQIEADQRALRDLDDKIFKIRFELQRIPGSQFLRDELKRTQEQRDRLQKKIDFEIQKGEK